MKEYKVSIEQLIDHIKTSMDVDPWAKEMAEELLMDRESEAEMEGGGTTWWFVCGVCHTAIDPIDKYCRECGRRIKWT